MLKSRLLQTFAKLSLAAAIILAGFYYMDVRVPEWGNRTGHLFLPDIYPTWYAVHAVVAGRDPYSVEATRQIQEGMYGNIALIPQRNQQRFAYPLFATFPAILLGFVSFPVAQLICFWGGILLAVLTTWLWCQWVECKFNIVLCAAALAAPPVTHAIALRQPTLLYLFFLALTAYLFSRERYWLSGVAGAVGSAKPQLAIFLLALLVVFVILQWEKRKGFVISYMITLFVLLGLSFALQPNWFEQWIDALKAYSNYGSLLEFYNLALLLPVCLWLWLNRNSILNRGIPAQLLFLVPAGLVGAGYCLTLLSCAFSSLTPLPYFFFNRAGIFLICEVPVICYLSWQARMHTSRRIFSGTGLTQNIPVNSRT